MRTLKQEEVDGRTYRDLAHAQTSIGGLIEEVHDRQGLHSTLDHLAPAAVETVNPTPVAAAQQPRAAAAADCP